MYARRPKTFKVLKHGGTDYNLLKTWCLLGFLRVFEEYFEVGVGNINICRIIVHATSSRAAGRVSHVRSVPLCHVICTRLSWDFCVPSFSNFFLNFTVCTRRGVRGM